MPSQPQSERYLTLLVRLVPAGMKDEVALASAIGESYVIIENEQAAQSMTIDEGKETEIGKVETDWYVLVNVETNNYWFGGTDYFQNVGIGRRIYHYLVAWTSC